MRGEAPGERDVLRGLGVRYIQKYLLARPELDGISRIINQSIINLELMFLGGL